jgi:hypothetical protein
MLVFASASVAATPTSDIGSPAGPLTHIYLGNDLSCQIEHTGDTQLEFFPPDTIPGDCGSFLQAGAALYGPDFNAHGGTATGSLNGGAGDTPFTAVNQSAVTGSGTSSSPRQVVTTADAGGSGLHVSQTDSYIDGNEFYRTDLTVSNSTEVPFTATIFHAGDCFLQNSDEGFGWFDGGASNGIFCTQNANNSPTGRILGFQPLTGGSHYTESFYATVWSQITAAGTQFPDACDCTTSQDNGAGLSWPVTVPAGGSTTVSFFSTFSPTGSTADQQITARGVPVSATEGRPFTGAVATFTDPDTAATPAEYSASISWGDGTTSSGTITGTGGAFTVGGTHTYAEEGSHTTSVTITDVDNPGITATVSAPVTVIDAALHGTGVNVKSKNPFNGKVASFTDDDPNGTVSDYTASISWGDGSTSTGTVTTGFNVSGQHKYKKAGKYTVTVTIKDVGGSTVTVTSTITIPSNKPAARRGTARLTGVPAACTLRGFRVQVKGKRISAVNFVLGSNRLKSRTVKKGKQYSTVVSLSPGKHQLTVKVKFTKSSHTRTRTFHATVSGCRVPTPKFTG